MGCIGTVERMVGVGFVEGGAWECVGGVAGQTEKIKGVVCHQRMLP